MTEFLESCAKGNYSVAEQYLDLSRLPVKTRAQRGVELAKDLEAILNQSRFSVLRLSQDPQGSLRDAANPDIEQVTTGAHPIELEHVQLQADGPKLWLFSSETVASIPTLTPTTTTESSIESRLPPFLVSNRVLETPLWKWMALLLSAVAMTAGFYLIAHVFFLAERKVELHLEWTRRSHWLNALLRPLLVFLGAAAFRVAEQIVAPSALAQVYIGDIILLVVALSFAWCLVNLVELFLTRVDSLLDPRQRAVSHSILYLGRRASRVVIFAVAAMFVLTNWGYPMTTIIAGLGVGGIAIALAAQQTLANVFGGVSVIGDHPVMVGDFGNFGGLIGSVEDIGMRSTRIRTLNRTIVSVPNATFAGMNLENFSERDKILFNPTLQVKRTASKDEMTRLLGALEQQLKGDRRVQVGPSPIRITNLTSPSFSVDDCRRRTSLSDLGKSGRPEKPSR